MSPIISSWTRCHLVMRTLVTIASILLPPVVYSASMWTRAAAPSACAVSILFPWMLANVAWGVCWMAFGFGSASTTLQPIFVDSTAFHRYTATGGIWWKAVESNDSTTDPTSFWDLVESNDSTTRSHQIPPDPTRSHQIPPDSTRSHQYHASWK